MPDKLSAIRDAIHASPRNSLVAEVWIQVIKHHDELARMTGKEFAVTMGLPPGYGPEFTKALKTAPRLVSAGLDVRKL